MSSLYDAIIVGTDGSPTSRRAVARAALYGEALDVPVVVASAYIRPTEGEVGPPSERATMPKESMVSSGYRAAVDLAEEASRAGRQAAPAAKIEPSAVEGDAANALIELAVDRGSSLLVVGNKGMTGSKRFVLGNVPNKISHHAEGDVLITRTTDDAQIRLPRSILIGTDGSATATLALDRGLALTAAVDAEATVLMAGGGRRAESVLEDAAQRAADAGVRCTTVAAPGEPAAELVAASEAHDLVVVGNKGMTGAARFLLGSVPNKVSHHIAADLLIIRTT